MKVWRAFSLSGWFSEARCDFRVSDTEQTDDSDTSVTLLFAKEKLSRDRIWGAGFFWQQVGSLCTVNWICLKDQQLKGTCRGPYPSRLLLAPKIPHHLFAPRADQSSRSLLSHVAFTLASYGRVFLFLTSFCLGLS